MSPHPTERLDVYVPQYYWNERGKNYPVGIANIKKDVEHLGNWISEVDPDSILDVGSGWGRVYSALHRYGLVDHSMYFMADFSDNMRKNCHARTGILPDLWDGRHLPYKDNAFDIVLSIEVMLHVRPDDINLFIAEHVRVATRWVYIITAGIIWRKPASHCFHHDYLALFAAQGLHLGGVGVSGGGKTMHWRLRK